MVPRPSELISSASSRLIHWYQIAKAKDEIAYWVLLGITIYIPYEDFILKWIPGPQAMSALLRLISEFILYFLFGQQLYLAIFRGKSLKKTPVDPLVVAFLFSVACSVLLNHSSIVRSVGNLRQFFRYITVYYIVVNLDLSGHKILSLLRGIQLTGLSQGILASFLYVAPGSVSKIFAPKTIWIAGIERSTTAGSGSLKVGAVAGTFGDSAVLSAFLIIPIAITLVQAYQRNKSLIPDRKTLLSLAFMYIGLFATKKRAGLGIALLMPILGLIFLRKKRKAIIFSWFYMAIGILLGLALSFGAANVDTSFEGTDAREEEVELSSYLLQIFTPDYWEQSSENSRGWFIKEVGGATLATSPWFGFGPDLPTAQKALADLKSDPEYKQRLIDSSPFFEDVYWVAMLSFFGVCGVLLFVLILVRIYQAARWLTKNSSKPEYQVIGATYSTIFAICVIYTFIERIFKLRSFAYYFWMLAGLVINAYLKERSQRKAREKKIIESSETLV